jgi:hypothetical protein
MESFEGLITEVNPEDLETIRNIPTSQQLTTMLTTLNSTWHIKEKTLQLLDVLNSLVANVAQVSGYEELVNTNLWGSLYLICQVFSSGLHAANFIITNSTVSDRFIPGCSSQLISPQATTP